MMDVDEEVHSSSQSDSMDEVLARALRPTWFNGFQEVFPICQSLNPDLHASDMPYPRSGHRLVANDRYAVSIGGYNPSLWNEHNTADTYYPILKEVWVFNLLTLRWKKLDTSRNMPKELASHAALLHDNYVIVYGGTGVPFGHNSTNKLNILNVATGVWRQLSVTPPGTDQQNATLPEQYGHAFVRDKKKLYITGGTSGFEFNMQVYELSMNESAQIDAQQAFKCRSLLRGAELFPRYRHEAFFFCGKLHVLGGGRTNMVCTLAKVDVFDVATGLWTAEQTQPDPNKGFPSDRRCHGLAVYEDAAWGGQRQSVYICGGYDGTHAFDDVWELKVCRKNSGIEYKWSEFPHKLPRPLYFHGMACTPNGSLIVFGGVDGRSDERSASLYRCWLKPPSLLEHSLRTVIALLGDVDQRRLEEAVEKLKLPQRCIDWVKNRW